MAETSRSSALLQQSTSLAPHKLEVSLQISLGWVDSGLCIVSRARKVVQTTEGTGELD